MEKKQQKKTIANEQQPIIYTKQITHAHETKHDLAYETKTWTC